MRRLAVGLLVLGVCGVLTTTPFAASGVGQRVGARRGTIAFVRGDRGAGRLFLARADGTRERRLRTRADGFPAWSPDGSKLAFYVEGPRTYIYVMRADGTGRRPITPSRSYACYWFSWSLSGRRIAYTLNDDCGGWMSVHVVGADGAGDRQLVPGQGAFDAVWSPNGKAVLYCAWVKNSTRLLVVGARGGRGRPIVGAHVPEPGGAPTRPAAIWSRDGKYVFFRAASGSLMRVSRDGGGKRNLTPALNVLSFALSPDGSQIALSGVKSEGTRDIFRLRADGKNLQKLTAVRGAWNEDPRWSPDGRLLAFTHRAHFGAQADIYVMRADGRDKRRVTRSPLDDTAPDWRPSG